MEHVLLFLYGCFQVLASVTLIVGLYDIVHGKFDGLIKSFWFCFCAGVCGGTALARGFLNIVTAL